MRSLKISSLVSTTLLAFGIAEGLQAARPASHVVPQASAPTIAFSRVTGVSALPNGMELHDGALTMRIIALRDDVVRVRASRSATLPEDASWAVLPASRTASVKVTPASTSTVAAFRTASLSVEVERATGLLTLRDAAGQVLQRESRPITFDGEGFALAKAMPSDEHYFGLGDKTGPLDRRDQVFRLWNTDAYGWQESTDPLYKSIPFYLSYRAGLCVGVLVDNTWPSSFDFGKTREGSLQYRADHGPADIYLLSGPSAKHVLETYAWLTGPTPLPPLWALGFQQSRYSYMTQERVLEVAARLRKDRIPADGLYLDIDYQEKNRPFTIDTKAFPDFAGMIEDLHRQQFHVVAITDLHIADLPGKDYAPYDTGKAGNHFVHNADGTLYSGKVWPGPSVFPDFTRQQTRAWWGGLYKNFNRLGVDGFWNDMNEPSVFTDLKTIPSTIVHQIDEPGFARRSATHLEMHNVYGMENTRATFEGQLALRPGVRPFVLTRAAYAGGQRYAATWTGDNSATWNHLRLTTSMLKNLGLSGFSMAGADGGGYAGTPTAELLTKWLEIGAFQPIDRDHAEKGTGDHEPWANGPEQEATRRHFIEERYKLLPYIYTVAEDGTRSGLPLLRPLFLEFPDAVPDRHPIDIDLDASGEFLLGPDLLIAPPPFPDKAGDYKVHLPSAGWYDYWTGERVGGALARNVSGGLQPEAAAGALVSTVTTHPELASLPVYVRPGSILPVGPVIQSTAAKLEGPLKLRVFPGPGCAGHLYQDDGSTFLYQSGDFLRMEFTCHQAPGSQAASSQMTIHIGSHQGRHAAWWHDLVVEVNGLDHQAQSVMVNGRVTQFVAATHSLSVNVPDDGKGIDITVQ